MHSPAHQEHAVDQKARLGTFPALRQLSMKKMKKKPNPNQNKPTHTSAYVFCRHSNTALPGNDRVMYVGMWRSVGGAFLVCEDRRSATSNTHKAMIWFNTWKKNAMSTFLHPFQWIDMCFVSSMQCRLNLNAQQPFLAPLWISRWICVSKWLWFTCSRCSKSKIAGDQSPKIRDRSVSSYYFI